MAGILQGEEVECLVSQFFCWLSKGYLCMACTEVGEGLVGPFWCRPCFGAATLLVVMTALITLTVGRSTWNSWVSGSQSSETITSWLMVLVGPVLVATCCVPFVVSAVLRTRHRRRSKQGAIFVPSHLMSVAHACGLSGYWTRPRTPVRCLAECFVVRAWPPSTAQRSSGTPVCARRPAIVLIPVSPRCAWSAPRYGAGSAVPSSPPKMCR